MSNLMNVLIKLSLSVVLITFGLTGCGGGGGDDAAPQAEVTLSSIEISPNTANLAAGETQQFTAIAIYSDDSTEDVTSSVTWDTSNGSNATVDSSGLVIAIMRGTTTITATLDDVTGEATVNVGNSIIYVNASTGDDSTGDGSEASPYQTISTGLYYAMSGDLISVAHGTYNDALGETFPIVLPAGVSLIGNESNKGADTKILGGGSIGESGLCGSYETTIYAGAGSVIAGFELTNTNSTAHPITLVIRQNNITIRNNRIINNTSSGGHAIYLCNASSNHYIAGNNISDNVGGTGLAIETGGEGTKVENNIFKRNLWGVSYNAGALGVDLGGGLTGSVGGNSFICNTNNDLWTNSVRTIYAENNFWDHNPPVTYPISGGSGVDIYNGSNQSTIITNGAGLAADRCNLYITP